MVSRRSRELVRGAWVAAAAAVLAGGLPAPAAAQPTPELCPVVGTLQTLIDLSASAGGCIIGDKLFSEFRSTIVSTGFATALTPGSIPYTLINRDDPGAWFHGFELTATWFAPAGGFLDHNFDYHVSVLSGAPLIHDATLSMFGEFILGTDGFIDISEDICVGGEPDPICPGPIVSLDTRHEVNEAIVHQVRAFWDPPVPFIHVEKDIIIFGGDQGAGFSNLHQTVSQVPEPSTVILLGAGLGLMGVVARSRRRQA